jgi:uncharacterized iron-regulated membrane protein
MIRLPQQETKTLVAIHGWAGTALGLLLYAVIVTGTVAVFAQEIRVWSSGALQSESPLHAPIDATLRRLAGQTPEQFRDDVTLRVTTARNVSAFFHSHVKDEAGQITEKGVVWQVAPDGRVISRRDATRANVFAQDTDGVLGTFFVDLHVRLHLPNPYGLVLTGVLGLAMLAAAVSGLLMHRHLFTDLFTLRGRVRMVGLRDLHTVAASWTLPHAFVLAFTGAFFSFATSIGVPLLAMVAFGGDRAALVETVVGAKEKPDPRPADGVNLDRVLADARARSGGTLISANVDHWGRADAHITVRSGPRDGALGGVTLAYDGATGAFVGEKPSLGTKPSLGNTVFELMGPLHFGNFAGWWSKAVWFALGFASAYVTWSGLGLWLRRRDDRPAWRAFGRVIAWTGAGLPFSMAVSAAAFFLALPSGATPWWTPAGFLIAAAIALLPALVLPAERVAPLLFGATGLVLLALPIIRIASGGPGWMAAFNASQHVIPALDTFVVIGGMICFVCAATALRRTAEGAGFAATMTPAE